MLAKFTGKAIFLISGILLVMLSFSFLFGQLVTYSGLIHSILGEINRMDLYEIIATHYFSREKYEILKVVSVFVSAFSLMGFIAWLKFRKILVQYFQNCSQGVFSHVDQFKKSLFSNSKQLNIALSVSLSIILMRSVWYAVSFYIQHDEAWNYNFFLQKNIIYSLFVYNNYPLHNMVSWLFVQLLPVSTFVLRLPSLLAGLLACMLVFVSVKKIFNSGWVALSAMCLFACLPVSVFYMLYARGVMFEIFFSLLVFYLLCQYLQGTVSVNKIIFLALLNAMGVMSMLSHVYFIFFTCVATTFYLLLQKEKQVQFIILYPLFSAIFSLFFLSPMLAGSGVSPGLNAGTSAGSFTILDYIPIHSYADFSTGIWFGFYLLLAANIFLMFLSGSKKYMLPLLINVVLLLGPFIIRYTTGISPPERAMAFLVIVPVSTFAIFVKSFEIRNTFHLGFTMLTGIALSYVVYHHKKLNWSKKLDEEVYRASLMLQAQNISSIHDYTGDFFYYIAGIQFYYSANKKEIKYTTSNTASTRFQNDIPHGTDCVAVDSTLYDKKLICRFDDFFIYDQR